MFLRRLLSDEQADDVLGAVSDDGGSLRIFDQGVPVINLSQPPHINLPSRRSCHDILPSCHLDGGVDGVARNFGVGNPSLVVVVGHQSSIQKTPFDSSQLKTCYPQGFLLKPDFPDKDKLAALRALPLAIAVMRRQRWFGAPFSNWTSLSQVSANNPLSQRCISSAPSKCKLRLRGGEHLRWGFRRLRRRRRRPPILFSPPPIDPNQPPIIPSTFCIFFENYFLCFHFLFRFC